MDAFVQEATQRLLELSKLSKKAQVMTVAERQRLVHHLQDQVSALRQQYRDYSLEFKGLSLAFEAIRIAWYAVGRNPDGCRDHLDHLARAFSYLMQHLEQEK
jgi:hypothetical protein